MKSTWLMVFRTRFLHLGYAHVGPDWRFVDRSDGDSAVIGPYYASRIELLADLERFAQERGIQP